MNAHESNDVTRRDFLRGGSVAAMLTMLGGAVELRAAEAPQNAAGKSLAGPKVKCGIIGLGSWGREILGTLQIQAEAEVAGLCDTYAVMLRRAGKDLPNALSTDDYHKLLEDKSIQAVFVATPTYQHKEIVLEALAAGKHVYCEAPLATTVEDARAIAKAANDAVGQVFQPGLSVRSDPQRYFLLQFIRTGAIGKPVMARSQWHKKQSWRNASSNPDREREINWRLDRSKSIGLAGEVGIHHFDSMSWLLKERPVAVTGFGSVRFWNDGRDVADTIQTILEFPGGLQGSFDATLASSYDADYELFLGSDATVMMRGSKAWLFKEVDSPLLGWEVYARKDVFGKETGIALVANASKPTGQEGKGEEIPFVGTPLAYSLEAFLANCNEISGAVEDFTATFDTKDKKALEKHLAGITRQHAATWREGLDATVIAIKANEAVTERKRIELHKEWFEI